MLLLLPDYFRVGVGEVGKEFDAEIYGGAEV